MHILILHIPHSSIEIPIYEGYKLDKGRLQEEILKLTDWYTDDLFDGTGDYKVQANFSRIFCDVERFSNDNEEIMAQFGMGALYEKTDSGELMREISPNLRTNILQNYYQKHHQQLNEIVTRQLEAYGKVLIIDCHSYSHIPFKRDLNQNNNRPDFCIGTDNYHTPDYLFEASLNFFKERGYSIEVNAPYSGSIVPIEYYQKTQNVHSIMLEVNRKLYLEEGTNDKSSTYDITKKIVTEYLELMRKY